MHSLLHLVGDHYGNLIGYVAIHRLTKLEGVASVAQINLFLAKIIVKISKQQSLQLFKSANSIKCDVSSFLPQPL